jgi:hypothetical protein
MPLPGHSKQCCQPDQSQDQLGGLPCWTFHRGGEHDPRAHDERRYRAVLKACALERDLAILDAGDQTLVGEKPLRCR